MCPLLEPPLPYVGVEVPQIPTEYFPGAPLKLQSAAGVSPQKWTRRVHDCAILLGPGGASDRSAQRVVMAWGTDYGEPTPETGERWCTFKKNALGTKAQQKRWEAADLARVRIQTHTCERKYDRNRKLHWIASRDRRRYSAANVGKRMCLAVQHRIINQVRNPDPPLRRISGQCAF